MKPQKALTASLATLLFTAFMLIPLNSSETVSKNQKKSSTNLKKVIADGNSKMDNKIDFTVPVTPTKNQEKQNEGKNNNHENNDLSKVRIIYIIIIVLKQKESVIILLSAYLLGL